MAQDMHCTPTSVPRHIGFIMDGNGRWATARALPRTAGHLAGLKACRRVLTESIHQGVEYVSLYVFSTENWKRSVEEVSYLMTLLSAKLHGELSFYNSNGIRILVRGDLSKIPEKARKGIEDTVAATAGNTTITCILCINYGGHDEIVRAVNSIVSSPGRTPGVPITTEEITEHLDLPQVPPPDIIARSAGEQRLSNFLLWESAYAELAFYDTLWPDWGAQQVIDVCTDFAKRTRKFGGVQA